MRLHELAVALSRTTSSSLHVPSHFFSRADIKRERRVKGGEERKGERSSRPPHDHRDSRARDARARIRRFSRSTFRNRARYSVPARASIHRSISLDDSPTSFRDLETKGDAGRVVPPLLLSASRGTTLVVLSLSFFIPFFLALVEVTIGPTIDNHISRSYRFASVRKDRRTSRFCPGALIPARYTIYPRARQRRKTVELRLARARACRERRARPSRNNAG